MEYKSVVFVYHNSLEKWEGIRMFAEANHLEVKYIDAMIARIKKVGDADLKDAWSEIAKHSYVVALRSAGDLCGIIYSDDIHPCPHCYKYDYCKDCPLWDGSKSCCEEWDAVKDEVRRMMEAVNDELLKT